MVRNKSTLLAILLSFFTLSGMEAPKKKNKSRIGTVVRYARKHKMREIAQKLEQAMSNDNQKMIRQLFGLLEILKEKPSEHIAEEFSQVPARILVNMLFAQGHRELGHDLINAYATNDEKRIKEITDGIVIVEHEGGLRSLLSALESQNISILQGLLFDGVVSDAVMTAIASEAVYQEKLTVAEWLFEHGVRFLSIRSEKLSTASLLWLYQHGNVVSVNSQESISLPCLCYAIMRNNEDFVRMGIQYMRQYRRLRNKNQVDDALVTAVGLGKLAYVKMILSEFGSDFRPSVQALCVTRAAALGYSDVLAFLLKSFEVPDNILGDALTIAASRKHDETVKFILKNYRDRVIRFLSSAFAKAVMRGNKNIAAAILDQARLHENNELLSTWEEPFQLALYTAGTHESWGLFFWVLDQALSHGFTIECLRDYFTEILQDTSLTPALKSKIHTMQRFLEQTQLDQSMLYGHLAACPQPVVRKVLRNYLLNNIDIIS